MHRISLVAMFAFWAVSTPAIAADYSRCHLYAPGVQVPYGIGADGKLSRPKKDPNLVSLASESHDQVATVKADQNMQGTGNIIYSVHSDHAKTLSYSEELGSLKVTYSFGYDGDNCYVAESSLRFTDPKTKKHVEQVSYSKDMCDQILQITDKLDNAKLQECGTVFSNVEFVRNQFQSKFAAQGRSLASPFSGLGFPAPPKPVAPGGPSAMDLISGCKGNRVFFPVDGIKPSIPVTNGAFFGNAPGGITGTPITAE